MKMTSSKLIFYIIFFSFIITKVYSQEEDNEKYSLIFTNEVLLHSYNKMTEEVNTVTGILYSYDKSNNTIITVSGYLYSKSGYIFDLIKKQYDSNSNLQGYVIKFWKFSDKGIQKNKSNAEKLKNSIVEEVEKMRLEEINDTNKSKKSLRKEKILNIISTYLKSPEDTIRGDYVSYKNNDEYFFIKAKDYDQNVKKYYLADRRLPSFSLGAIVVPVKIRLGDGQSRYFDLTSDVTLGPAFGVKWRLSHYQSNYFHILLGMGITNTKIDSLSSEGTILKPINVASFTPSISALFEVSGVFFGVSSGYDLIPGDIGRKWVYQNSPWISIGLGFKILSIKAGNSSEKTKSQ